MFIPKRTPHSPIENSKYFKGNPGKTRSYMYNFAKEQINLNKHRTQAVVIVRGLPRDDPETGREEA